jgi:hypothetical protein
VQWIAPVAQVAVVGSPVVGTIEPDDTAQKVLADFDAAIRRDYGDLQAYMRKVLRLGSPPSQLT